MMETPAGSPGALSRYTPWNGVIYVFVGVAVAILAFALLAPLRALGACPIWRRQR
jgi:hypothetical protein